MTNKEVSPESYDRLVERVLALEIYIEKNGLDIPDESWYPKILHTIQYFYCDISEMLYSSRTYPMGIKAYDVIKGFKTNIESLGISTQAIRYYQKPSMWPKCLREWFSTLHAKKYQKQSQEDSYGN